MDRFASALEGSFGTLAGNRPHQPRPIRTSAGKRPYRGSTDSLPLTEVVRSIEELEAELSLLTYGTSSVPHASSGRAPGADWSNSGHSSR